MDASGLTLGSTLKFRTYFEPDTITNNFQFILLEHYQKLKFVCSLNKHALNKDLVVKALKYPGKKTFKFYTPVHHTHVSAIADRKQYEKGDHLALFIGGQYWLECAPTPYLYPMDFHIEIQFQNAKNIHKYTAEAAKLATKDLALKLDVTNVHQQCTYEITAAKTEMQNASTGFQVSINATLGELRDELAAMRNQLTNSQAKINLLETNLFKNAPFVNTTIMTGAQQLQLNCLYGNQAQSWKLIYKGTVHGKSANMFHQRCDGHHSLMIVIKSSTNHIFGGYFPGKWITSESYYFHAGSFVFALVSQNEGATPRRFNHNSQANNSVYMGAGHGPSFGAGHDIAVTGDFSQASCYTNLGNSYSIPHGLNYNTPEGKNYFTGAYNFTVADIEVYETV